MQLQSICALLALQAASALAAPAVAVGSDLQARDTASENSYGFIIDSTNEKRDTASENSYGFVIGPPPTDEKRDSAGEDSYGFIIGSIGEKRGVAAEDKRDIAGEGS
ncbi:uncharacterized protein BCR38DRAFT_68799 [Pseudomassariella vexata]|uniref:Uncharacterized protein n=1 Tax=Pseudomassariella vexata TaxID=1141098 RepID=A0A1Y2DHL6_9PEZI|nr:uncharacterized protein BCR38DRAFT_68799 [Pseudomassariella vexata]ORY58737.1 hypothetical protein BCR38DRAFT_68799 [Pseudomassariella vexata]